MSESCGNPSVEPDALMTRKPKFDKAKQCVKCKERSGNIVIRHAVYCKSCFFPLVVNRFRKALEPAINLKPDGPRKKALKAAGSLVIGLSGGLGSTVLLDLVAKSYFHAPSGSTDEGGGPRGGTAHPRNLMGKESGIWRGKPAVGYVEVASAVPGAKERTEEVRKIVQSYSQSEGFEFDFVPLRIENAFDEDWWASVGGRDLPSALRSGGIDISDEYLLLSELPSTSTASTPVSALQTYLSSLPTQTAIQTAIQTLIRVLLLYTAASRDASHLLLGTSLTSLSINLISGIAQGSGYSVVEEVAEEWKYPETHIHHASIQTANSKTQPDGPPKTVRILRPLRDIGTKECGFWMWWCGLTVVGRERLGGGKQNIGSLTRDFITGLEQDFPSTVSTIARTCTKVTPKDKSDSLCILCERPAQPGVQEWKTRISIRSYTDESFLRSGHPPPPHLSQLPLASPSDALSGEPKPSSTLAPRLCYACHTTLTSRGSRGVHGKSNGVSTVVPLPTWVRAELGERGSIPREGEEASQDIWVSRQLNEKDIRSQIQDFLIDEQ